MVEPAGSESQVVNPRGKGAHGRNAFESVATSGGEISVGQIVLFRSHEETGQQKEPPYVGHIKSIFTERHANGEHFVTVNWLYRPHEVVDSEGRQLAPARNGSANELFYSFHEDTKVPVRSIMHPCKVHFQENGMRFPRAPGYVCSRLYDPSPEFCVHKLSDADFKIEYKVVPRKSHISSGLIVPNKKVFPSGNAHNLSSVTY
ncbi:hypothetical protein CYMTET_39683 [Cymbomonas tetramitiformis]|uniref:BAH domain-containing protein n=1 Tax=Cymbomonas tetramitiformis TaxID=36881 RepID=A0AAE0CAN9_9CHLO|nr:hypothetical protein CYMTET_39683 [Cymbomonas tetramitiformis]